MHVLFVHQNFPAQFGHIAGWLVEQKGWTCTYVSELPDAILGGVRRIQYRKRGGATKDTHSASRPVENYVWHSHAVYEKLKSHPDIQPDLIVGHSGFGSTCFLADLYDAPIINFFEWFYGAQNSDMDFRPDFPSLEEHVLRARIRNAAMLVDLESCAHGYSPTDHQRNRFPAPYQSKIETLFDGIDTDFWYRHAPSPGKPRWINDQKIPPDVKIVTYVSRGFESMRGFDIFMKVAKRICEARQDVIFVCVGSDRHCYGGDDRFTGGKPFREWVLAQDDYDLTRFIFTGSVPRLELVRLFGMSDLHVYLTVPFVLSWSLFDSLACGCTVLGSNTPPVAEVVRHGENGLLADFYDIDGLVANALQVLSEPEAYRHLGQAGSGLIERKYSMKVIMPQMLRMYEQTIDQYRARRGDQEFRPASTYGSTTPPSARLGSAAASVETPASTERVSTEIFVGMVVSEQRDGAEQTPLVVSTKNDSHDHAAHPLRVLLTIAHYFKPSQNGMYGSVREHGSTRLDAIRSCIGGWRRVFGGRQYIPSLTTREEHIANDCQFPHIDILVCTHGEDHLLRELDLPAESWRQVSRASHPMELGFECQALLREHLGRYDYYCYSEDDLVLQDPQWFAKLRWFGKHAGGESLLQPHRYETSTRSGYRKVYIDGDLPLEKTLPYQDIGDRWQLELEALGEPIRFTRPKNPHAGCYFLTAEQMERWTRQPYFLDRDRSFYSALESAATLGIMRTFRIYKAAPSHAHFFEIQHAGDAWTRKLDRR